MATLDEAYPSVADISSLFDDGQSPDAVVGDHGRRLVHKAALDGNCDVLRLLGSRGADLDALDGFGKSALNICLQRKMLKALELLLDLGADPNNATVRSESTLHQAAALANKRFVELLIEKGATCSAPDKMGDWPIHKASLEENVSTLGIIVHKFPQQISLKGNRGLTPLHIAANISNVEMFAVLAEHGANLCEEDRLKRTPMDIVIFKQDNYIIEMHAYLLVQKVLLSGRIDSFQAMLHTPQGRDFLNTLVLIDHEYRCSSAATQEEEEYCLNLLDDETNETLLEYIESDEKIDINEFVQIVVKAVRNGLVDEIIGRGLVPKISESIFKHVLMPQNEILLQELMKLGMLWSQIVSNLETNYISLYEKSLACKKVGIRGLVWRTCAVEGDQEDEPYTVSCEKLHKLLATVTRLWQLQHVDEVDEEANNCEFFSSNEAMKDPVQTLTTWSVLTGRLKLIVHLLRQEPYDLIPQALLAAKILRALSQRRDIEDVYCSKAEKVAATCEGVAIQALRLVKEIDTSQNNILTMEYLQMPLPSYGEYSIIDLAARGESSNFVTIDVVQDALDMYWYSDFFFIRSSWKMEAIIVAGFLPPLMLLLPTLMARIRSKSPSFAHADQEQDTKIMQVKGALDSHYKDLHDDERQPGENQEGAEAEVVNSNQHGMLKELADFYQIPCVKFRLHVVAHILFVLLLSFIVMRDFGNTISVWEITCYLCLLGFFVEEVNEIIKCKKDESLSSYLADGWNLIDLTAIFCGLLTLLIRLEYRSVAADDIVLYWSLVLLSTTCLVYWIRLLFASVILQSLGPKLKMMALMVRKDFMPFLYILFILMIGFGVIFQALLYPPYDPRYLSESGIDIFTRMFKTTFYMIVGDYSIDTNICDNTVDNSTICVHGIGARLVPNIFMVVYIVTMQILLLNVIVAMFSKTIDAINNESKAMWQFEKYDLIQEFFMRASLPPPLNTLLELRTLIVWLIRKMKKQIAPVATNEGDSNQVMVLLYYLYYQAISFRKQRMTLNGVVTDEEDLDGGNKIIYSEIMKMQKELQRLRTLETTVASLTGTEKTK